MIYNNTQELIEILKKYGIWANKDLGQNFLVNPQVLKTIVDAAELAPTDNVVEVGPGLGVLTAELAEHVQAVRSIEVDPNIIPVLKKNIAAFKNIEIEIGNALKARLPDYSYKLIANIPYYITSPLINHFLQPQTAEEKRPTLIVLLVQKEVAEKICANKADHSVLSLQTQIFGKPHIVGIVGKNSFYPQPKVDSAILKITPYEKPLIQNTELFLTLIKKLFAQRRKTLLNSLQTQVKLSKETALGVLEKAGIDTLRRPQALTMEEWQKLVTALEEEKI